MVREILISVCCVFGLLACNSDGAENSSSTSNAIDSSKQVSEAKKDSLVNAPAPKPEISYHFVQKRDWQQSKDSFEGAKHLDILIAINRVDSSHIKRLDSILVPSRYDLPLENYLPFPASVASLQKVKKMLIISNPFQAFAAYENGKLIRVGQVNSGKRGTPTPEKLYFCNWKSKKATSTVNSSWILKWNFNISNFGGIGFHEYALPGYPVSHSCVRMQESDAYFLYNWAEQWTLNNGQEQAKGTPVLVYGHYDFKGGKPWNELTQNPKALEYSTDSMAKMLAPYLDEILKEQTKRATSASSDSNVNIVQ